MRTYLCAATVICEVFRMVDSSQPFDEGRPEAVCYIWCCRLCRVFIIWPFPGTQNEMS